MRNGKIFELGKTEKNLDASANFVLYNILPHHTCLSRPESVCYLCIRLCVIV